MHIELGAHVWTQDGKEAGKVSKLVVDTEQGDAGLVRGAYTMDGPAT